MILLAASSKTWIKIYHFVNIFAILGRCLEEDIEVSRFHVLETLVVRDLSFEIAFVRHEYDNCSFIGLFSGFRKPEVEIVERLSVIHGIGEEYGDYSYEEDSH